MSDEKPGLLEILDVIWAGKTSSREVIEQIADELEREEAEKSAKITVPDPTA